MNQVKITLKDTVFTGRAMYGNVNKVWTYTLCAAVETEIVPVNGGCGAVC